MKEKDTVTKGKELLTNQQITVASVQCTRTYTQKECREKEIEKKERVNCKIKCRSSNTYQGKTDIK